MGCPANAIGTTTPGVVNSATRLTGTGAEEATLAKSANFTVEARFDLIIPDDLNKSYGIRLTDRQFGVAVGGTTGDDAIELRVAKSGAAGGGANPVPRYRLSGQWRVGAGHDAAEHQLVARPFRDMWGCPTAHRLSCA